MDIIFHGENVKLIGEPLKVGQKLPDFELTDDQGNTVRTDDLLGKLTLISVVPDLNTRVCSISTSKFNQQADKHPEAKFITISTNPTKVQKNWCALEGVKSVQVLSDEKLSFGKKMNLFIPTNGLDTRAIYIVDKDGTVKYREIIKEISNEPDYEKALAFIKQEAAN
ncbi:thiol peroxidase [Xylocopilactobacillus apis]|uniref:2-Cys peroxiredoxin n=1 Tax=Xylocopilactobacillus apis TaxID=2932183 RepID=A0AAU9DLH7_9LACO|nr:thiol peroxidase [Xylocopilactobacillus apis]BDR55658.1 2-Cys peroxiredoxin [Xylocopilactobacillus apis]